MIPNEIQDFYDSSGKLLERPPEFSRKELKIVKLRQNFTEIIEAIRKANETERWYYFDNFSAWLKRNNDGSNKPLCAVPHMDTEIQEYIREVAKKDVAKVENSDLMYNDNSWQVGATARVRIQESINIGSMVPSFNWIMADNSIEEVSLEDLQKVLQLFALRRNLLYVQYAQWKQTDMLSRFIPDIDLINEGLEEF